jgi:hypothetical protein
VEIIRLGNACLNEGNWDELFGLYGRDVEFYSGGADSVKALLIARREAREDFGAEV